MKSLILFGHPIGFGGHFNSGLAMVRYLCQHGHKVVVASPGGHSGKIEEFAAAGAFVRNLSHLKQRNMVIPRRWRSHSLIDLARTEAIDIVHAMDYQALSLAYSTAIEVGAGLVCTFPGGNLFHHVPPIYGQTVVFSQEQVDNLNRRYPINPDRLHLIPGRIDTALFHPGLESLADTESTHFLEDLAREIPTQSQLVVMATRFHPAKRKWFDALVQAADLNRRSGYTVDYVVAGDGELAAEVHERVNRVNSELGRKVIHLMGAQYRSDILNRLYNMATVVVGSGRGIMEAMAVAKPVVILNGQGQAHLVNRQCVDAVAYANFSGRHINQTSPAMGNFSAESLIDVLASLLIDLEQLKAAGDFSHEYIARNLDYRVGGEKLVQVYTEARTANATWQQYNRWYFQALMSGLARIPSAVINRLPRV